MPRISAWRPNHSNDFKFMDRVISEQFTVGGTGINVHKILGSGGNAQTYNLTANSAAGSQTLTFGNVAGMVQGQTITGSGITANTVITAADTTTNTVTITPALSGNVDAGTPVQIFWKDYTKPVYENTTATNIQDLLFLENRDRKYDTSVYNMRGIYQVTDNDFDLTQFGLFLSSDTKFITFHITDMVNTMGRKLMNGDVLELPHLTDYYPLDDSVPAAMKRYYVIQDTNFAAEGFSQTWWPHLWRVKVTPLVDSQEYKDLLNNVLVDTNGDGEPDTPMSDLVSNYDKLIKINDAIINQAKQDVPASGYNTSSLYIEPVNPDGSPGDPIGVLTATTTDTTDETLITTDEAPITPDASIDAYLGGDGVAPNGWPVTAASSFPDTPSVGDYVLRLDFYPNRLFRFDGRRWVKIEDAVRTDLTPGPNNKTQLSGFVNNTATYTDAEGNNLPERQSLSKALTPRADN